MGCILIRVSVQTPLAPLMRLEADAANLLHLLCKFVAYSGCFDFRVLPAGEMLLNFETLAQFTDQLA
jgi:hypothetical protein